MGGVAQLSSRAAPFHPSLLLNVADTDPFAPFIAQRDPSFLFTTATDHYDGVYFLAMAYDPFATGQAHELIDLAAYRYGHPFYSWLASTLSFGQPAALPWVFWFLSIASMAAAAWMVSKLCWKLGATPWAGLIVAVSSGLLFSATTALTEPFQIALAALLVLLWLEEKPRYLLLTMVVIALSLTKEQLILVPFALGLTLLLQMWRNKTIYWQRLAVLAAGPLTLGLWLFYVRGQFTAEQLHYDAGNVGVPVMGWLETFGFASAMRTGGFHESQIGSTAVPGLLAIAAVLLIAAVIGLRRRDELGLIVICQALLMSTLGWRTLLYPHEMFRIPSVALTFAIMMILVELSSKNSAMSKLNKG